MTTVYQVPTADLVRTTYEGEAVQPKPGAIIDGNAYVLRIDEETAYVHCTRAVAKRRGWTELAGGRNPWRKLAPEHKRRLMHARVYRRKDGKALPPIPDKGKALANARKMMGDDETPGEVDRLTLHMDKVKAGDLEEETGLAPHEWM